MDYELSTRSTYFTIENSGNILLIMRTHTHILVIDINPYKILPIQ